MVLWDEVGLCRKTAPQKYVFPRYSLQLGFAKKTTFQALKKVLFHTAHMKLREARLCICFA